MALRIRNREVEDLAAEVVAMTGESTTEAVRRALLERLDRLALQAAQRERGSSFLRYLEEEVWPNVPADQLGRRLSCEEAPYFPRYSPYWWREHPDSRLTGASDSHLPLFIATLSGKPGRVGIHAF